VGEEDREVVVEVLLGVVGVSVIEVAEEVVVEVEDHEVADSAQVEAAAEEAAEEGETQISQDLDDLEGEAHNNDTKEFCHERKNRNICRAIIALPRLSFSNDRGGRATHRHIRQG
jgi:hypothetical protein